ncbi:MAG TPA: phytanoyl-CoA dioxygenase family protein [Chloroflexota bacterium]|jgi:phytanoyl-CoA hydroxylase|nr:phytanoyl-CoA dioxygenase family protein [Chloroflexota bacterium]
MGETGVASRQAVGHLSDEQRRFYHEQGYLVFENVLSPQELAALQAASLRLEDQRRALGGDSRLAVIHNVALHDPAFMAAARHPFMLGVVSELLGPNLRLQHCKLNWKPPAMGAGEVHWHQDFPFFPHTTYDLLAVMFLLDDATPQNGCMRVIPGSHKLGPVDHYDAGGTFVGHCTDSRAYEAALREGRVVDFAVPAGSMTIHHCTTLHASYPNRSSNPRRGLVYQIAAGHAIQLGGNLHKVWSIWLQGQDPLQARLEGGPTFRLPRPLTNMGGLEPSADWKRVTQD